MLIDKLQKKFFAGQLMRPALEKLDGGDDVSLGVVASVRPFIVASLYARRPRPILVVVSGDEAAERFSHAVASYIGRKNVLVLPERMDLPWQEKKPDLAVVGARTRAIGLLSLGRPVVSSRRCAPCSESSPPPRRRSSTRCSSRVKTAWSTVRAARCSPTRS